MIKIVKITLKICFAFLFLFSAQNSCTKIFYYPDRKAYLSPEILGYAKKEIEFITFDTTRLYLWYIPSKKQNPKGSILQFHGNAENMTSHFSNLVWLADEGYDLYTYDYRGYGKSEGKPDRKKIHKDSVLVLNYINQLSRNKNLKLIAYGQSLGGIIALKALAELEDKENLSAVVIEGSFSSYRNIARIKLSRMLFPSAGFLLSFFFSDSYSPSDEDFADISPVPVIVFHGSRDDIVPAKLTEITFKQAKQPKILILADQGRHMIWNRTDLNKHKKPFEKILSAAAEGKIQKNTEARFVFE
ncbi:MAG: lysophospholipase [Spirochaetia bacterium]|nr:lysophospholipase [Spirochaetia bacterium]